MHKLQLASLVHLNCQEANKNARITGPEGKQVRCHLLCKAVVSAVPRREQRLQF